MGTPAIHVHTQADKHTVGFAKFMWETMISLANHPELLRLTAHCMGPRAVELLKGLPQSTVIQSKGRGDELHGSYGHGVCIMDALRMMTDADIHIIVDSDTVVVAKGWDDYIRQRIITDRIGMMGTTYEDLGGFSSGGGRVQTYKKVPNFTWTALNTRHPWTALDVLPNKSFEIAITDERLSKIYNLPIGHSIFGETSWQVPQFVSDNAIPYDGWKQRKPSSDALVLKGLSDYHEEYHAGDIPIVVHHRGSMKHTYRGDRISNAFYGAVDKYLTSERDREPRWSWPDDGTYVPVREPLPVVPPTVEVARPVDPPPPPVPVGAEWLKLSLNGNVIRARKTVDRSTEELKVDFDLPASPIAGHLRIEGSVHRPYRLVIPGRVTPYSITCRNATTRSIEVTIAGANRHGLVSIPHGTTYNVLVDIDGAFRIE